MGKKYTDEERKAICEAWRQSGLSKIAYCNQPGNVSEYALRQWLNKSEAGSEAGPAPIKFLQINHQLQTRGFIEATLPNGILLKFDISALGGVLGELLKWK